MNALPISISGEKDRHERKNLFLYSTGKTVSIFGTAIYNFTLGLYVLKLTGSALSFAVTLILGIIPMILMNPFAGVMADKFNKKTIVVSMDLANGVLLVFVYVLSNIVGLHLFLIYATTFLMTLFTTFFGVGLEAAKPNMVSEKRLMNMNSISKIIDSVATIMGPVLGGMVFAIFDIKTFIIINGISFIFSGFSMMFINFKLFKHHSNEESSGGNIHIIRDIKDGFHYLLERKSIMNLFILLITLNFFLGFAVTIPLPYIINTVLELGSKEFGMIHAAFPVGMILGAVLVKKITKRISYSSLLTYLSFSLSIFMIIIGFPVMLEGFPLQPIFYIVFYSAVMFFIGTIVALIDIPISFFMQKEIPDEYRGRVISMGISIGKTMLPMAMLTSGVLLNLLPSYFMPIAGGMLFLLFNLRSTTKVNIEITSEKIGA
ncbi:MFS transporter [Peribacillus acanthi]|uniref:MFS transporter n=1 Tax=Peribacillus acanthi TaxID=2171554 RepID=UPI000D3E5799|nr:MFS transporter [Peribacillus acanthi]